MGLVYWGINLIQFASGASRHATGHDRAQRLEREDTAQRFSCVLGMLSSLGVKVPRPT
jgi:hypothetical protein